jgi:hypothetical protein
MNRHPHRILAPCLALALALTVSSSAAAASPRYRASRAVSPSHQALEVFVRTAFPWIWPLATDHPVAGRFAGKEGVSIDPDGAPHAAPNPQLQPNEGGSLDPDGR